jgi:putative glutamate/gamma-aminobutyrate antiporter
MRKSGAPPAPGKKALNVFTLVMMNLAVICTLRGLPMMAEDGFSLVFYYLVTVLVFVIPVSLVSAELATSWPPRGPGGVYIWVKEAFGERWGFLAIWLQWIQNVIWFPTALSFIAGTMAYVFAPQLANNKVYMVVVILVVYWGGTLANFRGTKTSGTISSICVIGGVFVPGALIIMLGIIWIFGGNVSQISFSAHTFFPDLSDINNIVFLAGAFLIFAGIEVSAVHTNTVRDPKRDFPRAILLSSAIAVVILILGSLAIAVVVPQKELNLVAGIMQAFHIILLRYHMEWMVPLIALLIALGSMGEITTWIAGPSKGLHTTAKDGCLPPFLQHMNRHGVATHILIVQGCIVSVLALVFLLMPNVSSSYWILSALCVILYLMMYVLFYASALRLRYKSPKTHRPYRIPGGNFGMWMTCIIGIAGALFALIVGFFPPSQLKTGSTLFYELFLIIGVVFLSFIPIVIYQFKKPEWQPKGEK